MLCYRYDRLSRERHGHRVVSECITLRGCSAAAGRFPDTETLDLLHVLFTLCAIWKTLLENIKGYIAGKKRLEEDESP